MLAQPVGDGLCQGRGRIRGHTLIRPLIRHRRLGLGHRISLKSLKVFAGTGEPQRAEMKLDVNGEIKSATETGDGPVDAIFKCIKNLYPHEVNLQLYQVHAVTEGTDAQATVSVRIEENGKTTVGQAADTDTLVASANAYISALNKMILKRGKTAPMEQENQKVRGI